MHLLGCLWWFNEMLIWMLEPNDKGVKNILPQLVPLFLLLFSEYGCLLFQTQSLTTVHKVCVCVCYNYISSLSLFLQKSLYSYIRKRLWPHLFQLLLSYWVNPPFPHAKLHVKNGHLCDTFFLFPLPFSPTTTCYLNSGKRKKERVLLKYQRI